MDVNSGWRGGGGGRRGEERGKPDGGDEQQLLSFEFNSKKFHFQEVKTVSASSLIS